MRSTLVLALGCAVLASSSIASAQSPADQRRASDAAVDRNILFSSAETIGEGAFAFNSYELFLAGLTYGITNELQVSGTVLLPVIEDMPFLAIVSAKYQLLRQDQFLLSVQPHLNYLSEEGAVLGSAGVNLIGDYIIDPAGRYVAGFGVTTYVPFGSLDGGDIDFADGVIFTLTGSFSARLGSIVKLLAEITVPGGYAAGNFEIVEEVFLGNYGVRFFGESVAVDLSFLKPLNEGDTPFVMGIPWVAFSARF